MSKILKLNNQKNTRFEKKLTRIEKLEKAVKNIASFPQFILENYQKLHKVVQDLRFTYEIIGIILMEKGIVTQEEVNAVGKRLVEERRRQTESENVDIECEVTEVLSKEQVLKELMGNIGDEKTKEEISKELMKSNEELKKEQVQNVDVSIKKIGE